MKRIARLIQAGQPFRFDGRQVIPLRSNRSQGGLSQRGRLSGRTRRASISDPASAIRDYFREFSHKVSDFELHIGLDGNDNLNFIDRALDKAIRDINAIGMPADNISYKIDDDIRYNETDPVTYRLDIRLRYSYEGNTMNSIMKQLGWRMGTYFWNSPDSDSHYAEPGHPCYSFRIDTRSGSPAEALITVEICYADDATELFYSDEYDNY